MATVACPAPARTTKPSRNELARTFLVEMGYDRATAAAALADPSLVSLDHAASVARILDVARTVEVKGSAYQIEPLHSPDGPAYRLTSPKGKVYDVEDKATGAECDCPDFVCRRAGLDAAGCKHVKALKAAGLIANAHTAAPAPLISNEPGVEARIEREISPNGEAPVVAVEPAVEAPAPAAVPAFSTDPAVDAAIGSGAAGLVVNAHTPPPADAFGRSAKSVSPAPAPVPAYSDDPAVEAAIHEARACLWPCSDRYKADMGSLADRADRLAAILAAPPAPADARHDAAAEPGTDGASTADAWPAWVDEFRWELGAGEGDDEGGSEFEGWAAAPPSSAAAAADPAAAAAFEAAWLADLADPRSHLYAAKLPARPAADERPIRVSPARRTNVGSCYGDEDQLISKGCV